MVNARLHLKLPPFRLGNPMIRREMRARMRSPRAFIILALYLAVLTGVTYGVYLRSGGGMTYAYGYNNYTATTSNGSVSFGPTQSFKLGQNIFLALTLSVLILAAIITPALTAGVISREREGRTYDLLFATPLGARRVITGKLLSALGFVFLLDLAALPLMSVVFIFGGVVVTDVLTAYALILLTTTTIGMLGVFFSALTRRTTLATILTYAMVGALFLGILLWSSFWQAGLNAGASSLSSIARNGQAVQDTFLWPRRILALDPLAAAGAILAPDAPTTADTGDLSLYPNSQLFSNAGRTFSANAAYTPAAITKTNPDYHPLWYYSLFIYAGSSLVLYVLSIFLARPTHRRFRLYRRRRSSASGPPAEPEQESPPSPKLPRALG